MHGKYFTRIIQRTTNMYAIFGWLLGEINSTILFMTFLLFSEYGYVCKSINGFNSFQINCSIENVINIIFNNYDINLEHKWNTT